MSIFSKNRPDFNPARPVEWVAAGTLTLAPWRTTYIIKTDLEVLQRSLEDYGWLQPLVVQQGTGVIIDGNYRWEIASHIDVLSRANKNKVPVIFVDCDDVESMVMHIRLNRGRGISLAKRVSRILQKVSVSRKYPESHIKRIMAMHSDEIELMLDGTLLKDKSISEHKYSSAWVPIEAPSRTIDESSIIERPPNNDQ